MRLSLARFGEFQFGGAALIALLELLASSHFYFAESGSGKSIHLWRDCPPTSRLTTIPGAKKNSCAVRKNVTCAPLRLRLPRIRTSSKLVVTMKKCIALIPLFVILSMNANAAEKLQHVVSFKFKDSASPEAIKKVEEGFRA